jgi:hypothetical protein
VVEKQEATPFFKQCKDCEKQGHTKEDYWKLHPEKFPKNFEKRKKKKALINIDVEERVDNTLYLQGNIGCTTLQKELAQVGYNHKEEKEMIELFYIKIHMKQSKLYCLFDLDSQSNFIIAQLVEKLSLDTHDPLQ